MSCSIAALPKDVQSQLRVRFPSTLFTLKLVAHTMNRPDMMGSKRFIYLISQKLHMNINSVCERIRRATPNVLQKHVACHYIAGMSQKILEKKKFFSAQIQTNSLMISTSFHQINRHVINSNGISLLLQVAATRGKFHSS